MLTPATPRGVALLVPGFTGSKEDFAPLLPPLAERGWQVVALDQRGQYETVGPDDPQAYTVDALAADLVAVAAGVARQPVHLVGHSFGGLVARAAVLARPAAWASLTLLDSGPGPVPEPGWPGLRRMRDLLASVSLAEVWARRRRHQLAAGAAPGPVQEEEFLRARFTRHNPACLSAMAEQLMTVADRTDELAALLRIHPVPTLVAWGEDDDAWPPAQQQRTAQRLGARWVAIPGAGHSPAVQATDQLVDVLDEFWGQAAA
jgi:pimeloyl-ACP methyl ester carboxylesterase